jgi:hypothetical protein
VTSGAVDDHEVVGDARLQFELVPPELRGRVFGAVKAGAWAAITLGVLVGGAVVAAVGVGATFLGIGLCYLGVTVYGFFNPAFRELDAAASAGRPPLREGDELS